MLVKFASEHASIEMLVLCGHSHEACVYHPLNNLTILVGKAEYGRPVSQGVIETLKMDFCFD
jgi:predicted MPP superfamily phosphohydrolase